MDIRKPNVLVAGFPRSGSTYLYNILKQHPEIYIPGIKEINYFNKDHFFMAYPEILNPRYFKPKKWYYQFFKTRKNIIMDFSILSALDVSSAKRVRQELGDIKILFITRKKEDFKRSVNTMLAKWGEKYDWKEDYTDFDHYINYYKLTFSNVYVTSTTALNKNPQKELQKIVKFLGAKPYSFDLNVLKHETKKEAPLDAFSYYRRKILVSMTKLFYKFLSLNVLARAMPDKQPKKQ